MICVFMICREQPKAHRKWFYGEAGNGKPTYTTDGGHHKGFYLAFVFGEP